MNDSQKGKYKDNRRFAAGIRDRNANAKGTADSLRKCKNGRGNCVSVRERYIKGVHSDALYTRLRDIRPKEK